MLTKVSFASASMSAALLNEFFQSKARFFYITEMKLSPQNYAIALGIWAVWNSINDPLMGWVMDRNSTRWGRRLPWMVGFWVPLVVSFGLIFSPPLVLVGRQIELLLWVLVILILFDTSYTAVILAWAALFPELFLSKEDRSTVAGLRQLFSLFALVLALIIPPFFVSDGDIESYRNFAWILAVVSFVNIGFAFYGCREPEYQEHAFDEPYSIREGIDLLKTNKNFQAFLIGNLITFFAYGQVLAMLPFYRKYVLLQDEGFETMAYGGAIGMTAIAVIFWIWLTNKTEPRTTYIASAIFFALAMIPIWFLEDPAYAILMMTLVGIGLAGLLMVVDLLLADVVDEDFLQNEVRREGIFFGFNGFFIRLAILLEALALAIVSYLTGFDENAEFQTELAQTGIKIQFILLPVIGFITGIFVIYKYYGIHGEELRNQREEVSKAMIIITKEN